MTAHADGCLDLDDTHRGVCRTSPAPAPTPDFTVEVINGAIWIFTDAASISLTRAQAVAVGVAGASVGAA